MINEQQNINLKKNESKGFDIKKLGILMLKKLPIIAVVTVLMVSIGFCKSKYMTTPKYTARTYLYVKNTADASTGNINKSDIETSKSLVNTYMVILQNNAVLKEIANRMCEQIDEEKLSKCFNIDDEYVFVRQLKSSISMTSESSTEVMVISAETMDSEISAAICDIYSDVAPDFLIRIVGAGSVEAVGDAEVLRAPTYPNVMETTKKFAEIGLLMSVAFVILIYVFDKTIKSDEELQNYGLVLLGKIPKNQEKSDESNKKKLNNVEVERKQLIYKNKLPFAVLESYNVLRTNIIFSLSTSDKNIFAVTSPNPSEGKSTVSVNIATAMAMAEKKILLIDADLRKPVQHIRLSLKNKIGLSDVLCNIAVFDDAVNHDVITNLDVITAGTKPPNPSELIGSKAMSQLLETISKKYDCIIIDLPPVNVVSDALGIASSIAGYVFVTRYKATKTTDIEAAIHSINMVNSPILGAILVDVENESGSYGKYGKYGKYSKYGKYGYSSYEYGGTTFGESDDKTTENTTTKA